MMKGRMILGGLFCALLLASQPCAAASNKANANSGPGNPFDALRELIEENRTQIEENQSYILELEEETFALNDRIDAVENDLADIADQVAANSADIADAFARIADVAGNVETLRNDLDALAKQYQLDIAAIEERLESIQLQIDDLVAQSAVLATELNNRTAELRELIDNNSVGIDALVMDIGLLNAQMGTINSAILALTNEQSNLSGQVKEHSEQLENLFAAVEALKSKEGETQDPCLEFISLGDTVSGELLLNGECMSGSRGNNAARYYTFTVASAAPITIEMQGSACGGGGSLRDPYLYLHVGGRDGAELARNDDSGCGVNARITRTLEPGTYTVEATSFSRLQGTFQLSTR